MRLGGQRVVGRWWTSNSVQCQRGCVRSVTLYDWLPQSVTCYHCHNVTTWLAMGLCPYSELLCSLVAVPWCPVRTFVWPTKGD